MTAGHAATRNSRWNDAPVCDREGRAKIAVLTDRDIDGILLPLARYRYLPADYLHAFAGGSLEYLINRLNLLARRPNVYVRRPHQQRASAAANHRRLIYELTDKGLDVIRQRGSAIERVRFTSNFAHELMTCQIMASFEFGARRSGARLISWHDIRNSKSLPEKTRSSAKPFAIPVTVMIDGRETSMRIAADGTPFGVERDVAGHRHYFFCPGVEADCGTEPIDSCDLARSSIYKKFMLYLAIEAQGIFRAHFGFPNFYVPIITTNATRLASMVKALERITNGAGSQMFLFKTFPTFTSFEPVPAPSGHMLTEDWQRAGRPPFNFLSS